jgi:hypothetical protein
VRLLQVIHNTDIDERIILRWILFRYDVVACWKDLAQVRDKWRAVGNAAINLWVL